MALLDFKTDLKSLKYADFSTKVGPPIQKDINDPPSYNRFSKPITARADDLVRMTRLLVANRGTFSQASSNFLASQAIIATARGIDAAKKGEDLVTTAKDFALDAGKTVAGLLAQTPVAGTGVHFIYAPAIGKQYLKESGQSSNPERGRLGRFLQGVAQFSGIAGGGGVDGAKAALAGVTIIADSTPQEKNQYIRNVEFNNYTGGRGVDDEETSLLNTFETSSLRTRLNELRDTTSFQKNKTENGTRGQIFRGEYLKVYGKESLLPPRAELPDGSVRYFNGLDLEQKIRVEGNVPTLEDKKSLLNINAREQEKSFIKEVNGKFDKNFTQAKYTDDSTPIRIMTNRGNSSPFKLGESTGDQRNLIFEPTVKLTDDLADIIPFEFQILIPGRETQYVYFRAYLDSFNDNFSSEWAGTKYIGRADDLYIYNGFSREINFDFKIAALTQKELIPLYEKLNFLVSTTAPSYDTDGTFMRGVFNRITIGDYLQNVPGFFKNINLTWDKSYPWQIEDQDEALKNPTVLNISTTYQPVHDFNPAFNRPFIGAEVG